jgi:DNA mismatch endonuclease (patch repair protein)
MSRIGGKNTAPELAVRSLVHSLGYRYRLHSKKLPGKPDLVFAGRRKVIFVHGCFWHGHEGCKKGQLPKSRLDYWKPKIEANKQRDYGNETRLKDSGWNVLVVWQCDLKDSASLEARIVEFLESSE